MANVDANVKVVCNNIVQHFSSRSHGLLMKNMNQNPNVSLWKLVYDCYAPELIKSNEECVRKVENKFRCTVFGNGFLSTEDDTPGLVLADINLRLF